MSPTFLFSASAFLLLLVLVGAKVLKIGSRPSNLPPGPKTKPVWGNLGQFNILFPQYKYTEWAKQFGPVYTVMQGDTPHLVVSRADEAREIFVKQGANTQGRGSQRFQVEAMRDGFFPSLMEGPKWREARKMWASVLSPGPAKQYIFYQEMEAHALLHDVVKNPAAWRQHIERYANSIAMTMVNGQRVKNADDECIKDTIQDLFDMSEIGMRGAVLDLWPFLWKLPKFIFPVFKEARRCAKKHRAFILKYWNGVKDSVAQGTAIPSFNKAINDKLVHGYKNVTELEAAEIGYTLLTGTTDTTSCSLINFVAAICLNPEPQRKAQEEIDRVVGRDRLPEESDAPNLLYTRQLILEAARWITTVPLALPKSSNGPVRWRGYDIPSGTGLVLNSYAIHRDPDLFPSPERFEPERWAGRLDAASPSADEQILFTFGTGRRICPGQHLAERSLFIVISRWLWAFDTHQAKDERGRKLPINIDDLRPGFITCVNPFKAEVRPRDEGRAKFVLESWQRERERWLDEDEQWKSTPEGVANLLKKIGG
ncbi:putative cytochrome P450 [Macrophomina phaseolina]|uniref:Cytochrome P450 n=1 Tax=Macrophomina phaseolina TaxID=35725 RepID=A0ABQ8G2N7_9PEZI|nr:putative cytochrome P450 [Macrophomina phaseolina]